MLTVDDVAELLKTSKDWVYEHTLSGHATPGPAPAAQAVPAASTMSPRIQAICEHSRGLGRTGPVSIRGDG